MKKITFKQNKKVEDIAEVCRLAADYFWVFTSQYNTTGEMELQDDDSNVDEALDAIRDEMTTGNQYKASDNKSIKKILKDNYLIVELYESRRCLESAADRSWDNAVFNGGN